jgi:hypothetical protein
MSENTQTRREGMKKSLGVICLLFSFVISANPLQFYEKRFELVKEDGKLKLVRDSSLGLKFKMRPYLKALKESLIAEQKRMKNKADYNREIDLLLGEKSSFEKSDIENKKVIKKSLKALENIDIEKIFADSGFQDVMNKFEGRLQKALEGLDPRTLAHVQDQRFFYRKNVTYQVVKWALGFAKKRLSTVPLLNAASYVLVKVESLIRERRLYHQNMLLHYLENFSGDELGMTHLESNHVFSSIYESRIQWFMFWESNIAVKTWDRYGTKRFYQELRNANSRFRPFRRNYGQILERLDFAFQKVNFEGEDLILNLFHKQSMFNKRPSIAFNYSKPKKVARLRSVLQLAELGLNYLSLPSFIKSLTGNYMKSFYKEQTLLEGALFAHFESENDEAGMRRLRRQYVNPYDLLFQD